MSLKYFLLSLTSKPITAFNGATFGEHTFQNTGIWLRGKINPKVPIDGRASTAYSINHYIHTLRQKYEKA